MTHSGIMKLLKGVRLEAVAETKSGWEGSGGGSGDGGGGV